MTDTDDSKEKLENILQKWHEVKSVGFLTEEMCEYLCGIRDGIKLSDSSQPNDKILERLEPIFAQLQQRHQEDTSKQMLQKGKIQFDCRLLNPSDNYSKPFDEDEEYFIKNGQLNEKQLAYLANHKDYHKSAQQKAIELEEEEKNAEMKTLEAIEKIKQKNLYSLLKNYIKRYGLTVVGNDYMKLSVLLERENLNIDFKIIVQVMKKIKTEIDYEEFKKRMLSSTPKDISEYIHNYLEISGDSYDKNISLLEKLFAEQNTTCKNLPDVINKARDDLEINRFAQSLSSGMESITIKDCDKMTGKEFEHFVGNLFEKMAYLVEVTKHSGDQGGDIIAEKLGRKTIIQGKRSSSKITNKAVQEVVAAKNHYNADDAMVVTNNYFQNSAIELAKSNKVTLIDRGNLQEWIKDYPVTKTNKESQTEIISEQQPDLPLLKDELLVKILNDLEGPDRVPIPERMFVKHLIKDGKFTENSARSMVDGMEFDKKIYQPKKGAYNTVTKEILAQIEAKEKEEEQKRNSRIAKMQLFLDTLRRQEGDNKVEVKEDILIDELVGTGKFTQEDARNHIRMMLREANIYESRPGCYNRT